MNTFDGTTAELPSNSGSSRNTVIAVLLSLLAPIVACFIVIDWLVGVENLKVQYWLADGLAISIVLNVIGLSPLAHPKIRKIAPTYAATTALLIFLFTLGGYSYWTVALLGV